MNTATKKKPKVEPPATAEEREFRMHPKLLYDIIFRQAGTLAKAILEAVMNSIDAQATFCRIDLKADQLAITDDGRGIISRKEIEDFFEEFGAPHSEEEQKQKTYATFRMGRGQLFAFGVNLWQTANFEMEVDAKKNARGYILKTVAATHPGCKVTIALYEHLKPSELLQNRTTIKDWVRFAPVQVYWNDELLSKDVAKEKWDIVNDDAYIRLDPDRHILQVYNLGIHTNDVGSYQLGTGGVVVSKQKLKVNFARNDIQSDCPVWRRIKTLIDKSSKEKAVKKGPRNDAQRARLVAQYLAGEVSADEFMELPLVTTVNGRHWSPERALQLTAYYYRRQYSCCRHHDIRGDILFGKKAAFILSDVTLARFELDSAVELIKLLQKALPEPTAGRDSFDRYRDLRQPFSFISYEELTAGLKDDGAVIPESQYTPLEKIWINVLIRLYLRMSRQADSYDERRIILLGTSPTRSAWTDGSKIIVVTREFLAKQLFDTRGLVNAATVIAHEICHNDDNTANCVHGQEFHERFHDLVCTALGDAAQDAQGKLPQFLAVAKRRLDKRSVRSADHIHAIVKGVAALNGHLD